MWPISQSKRLQIKPHFQNPFHWRCPLRICTITALSLICYLLNTAQCNRNAVHCTALSPVKSHYIPVRVSMSRLRTTHYNSLSSLLASSYSPPSHWQLKSQVEHFRRDRTYNWNFQQVDAVGTLEDCLGTWRLCRRMCSVILLTVSKIWTEYYLPPCKPCQTNLPTSLLLYTSHVMCMQVKMSACKMQVTNKQLLICLWKFP